MSRYNRQRFNSTISIFRHSIPITREHGDFEQADFILNFSVYRFGCGDRMCL
jgi:hypothetical protein